MERGSYGAPGIPELQWGTYLVATEGSGEEGQGLGDLWVKDEGVENGRHGE